MLKTDHFLNEEEFENYLDQQELEQNNFAEFNPEIDSNIELEDDKFEELIAYSSKKPLKSPQKNENDFFHKTKKTLQDEQDLLIGRKIVLFPLIIDLDYIGDPTDVYQPYWAYLFLKAKEKSEKIDSFIQMIEVGETFSLAAADNGNIFSWGNNDFFQLGRLDENEDKIVGIITLPNEIKQPQKVNK